MVQTSVKRLIARIHDSQQQLVLAATGGGSQAMTKLLSVEGASQTFWEATVPYAPAALSGFLGWPPEKACTEAVARAMAVVCFERASLYAPTAVNRLAGVASTASLVTNRPRRGPHCVHLGCQTDRVTTVVSLEMEKGRRTRQQEESLCARLFLNLIAEAAGIDERCRIGCHSGEVAETVSQEAPKSWTEVFLGQRVATMAGTPKKRARGQVIFPGTFHPLHAGHREMVRTAEQLLGEPVEYEISLHNVDKPPLDFVDVARCHRDLSGETWWLTRAATFVDKARIFPGATFLVGADTIARITDLKYYCHDGQQAAVAINEIADKGCRFLVFGRLVKGRFTTIADLPVPPLLAELCQQVPTERFRHDISSSEIRHRG